MGVQSVISVILSISRLLLEAIWREVHSLETLHDVSIEDGLF